MAEPEWLTVAEVAEKLRVDQETVRRWLRAKRLRGTRLGNIRGGWRIRPVDLDRFIREQSQR